MSMLIAKGNLKGTKETPAPVKQELKLLDDKNSIKFGGKKNAR